MSLFSVVDVFVVRVFVGSISWDISTLEKPYESGWASILVDEYLSTLNRIHAHNVHNI